MFVSGETGGGSDAPLSGGHHVRAPLHAVESFIAELATLSSSDLEPLSPPELIRLLHLLEAAKSACAATQAVVTLRFVRGEHERMAAAGTPEPERRRSINSQVALARMVAPHQGGRHVGFAAAVADEMPGVRAALSRGELTEWRATLIVKETACLAAAHRTALDAELAGTWNGRGDRAVVTHARAVAHRLDPALATARMEKAAAGRRVTIRPLEDGMTAVTAILPVIPGVAVYGALRTHADLHASSPDAAPRSRGQVMADEFVRRLLQPGDGDAPVGIEVQLIVSEESLFAGGDEPATVIGYGPVPAPFARSTIRDADPRTKVWVRRLYRRGDRLVDVDRRRRRFPHRMRTVLVARDQTCRTPFCGSPIRHIDHIQDHHDGGPTELGNGQGLCEHCNYLKSSPGWSATRDADGTVRTRTPHGQTYVSPERRVSPR